MKDLTDGEYKQLMRRLRFQCSPGAEEIYEARWKVYDWGMMLIIISSFTGVVLYSTNDKDSNLNIAGIIAILFSALLFITVPFIGEWRRNVVSRRVHKKYMCQCDWHKEKFGKN